MISEIIESPILAPALLSFTAALALQITVRRLRKQTPLRSVLTVSLVVGALLCVLWLWARSAAGLEPVRVADALASLAIYVGLAYMYADFYGGHRGSIRLQALRCIHRNGGAATRDELVRVCGTETIVDHRLAQYLQRGELALVDGRYRLARRRILNLTRAFRLVRRLMLGTREGSV